MSQCCRCNGSDRCANCACVKAKNPCTNCLPGRKARCSNTNTAVLLCPPPLNQPPGPVLEVDGPTSGDDALPRDVQPCPPPPSQSSGPVSEEDGPMNGDALPRDVEGQPLRHKVYHGHCLVVPLSSRPCSSQSFYPRLTQLSLGRVIALRASLTPSIPRMPRLFTGK